MSHFLIVGKSFGNLQKKILGRNDTYTLLQDKKATKFPTKKIARRVVAGFSDEATLLAAVDSIDLPIDGVITIYENYVLPTAIIANHLGLPGLSIESAMACSDKQLMRSLFAQAPTQISPDFATVNSISEVLAFANDHAYPLILKPANLAKSLLVTKNNDEAELVHNYHKSIQLLEGTYKKYAPDRQPKMLIEEFMQGSIHSVDAYVDQAGNIRVLEQVVDYQTGYDIGYDDNFHYSRLLPSQLPPNEIAAIRKTATLGIRALGMTASPAHVEVILTNNGPRIVEIGARNGGYRERMHGLANGIDIIGCALDTVLGKTPNITATRNDFCAVLELFPKKPGSFNGIQNEAELQKLNSLAYYSLKATPGQFVGKSSDGHKMCAIIMLHNADEQHFKKDLEYVNNEVRVLTT